MKPEQFWSKVDITRGPFACWHWTGAVRRNGYGAFKRNGAHRASYELNVGTIPSGLVIDHVCSNRACVNPYHLEAVSQAENVRRYTSRLTACQNGHDYSKQVPYSARGWRECSICRTNNVRNGRNRKQHV